jgi:hypothetical protein
MLETKLTLPLQSKGSHVYLAKYSTESFKLPDHQDFLLGAQRPDEACPRKLSPCKHLSQRLPQFFLEGK